MRFFAVAAVIALTGCCHAPGTTVRPWCGPEQIFAAWNAEECEGVKVGDTRHWQGCEHQDFAPDHGSFDVPWDLADDLPFIAYAVRWLRDAIRSGAVR